MIPSSIEASRRILLVDEEPKVRAVIRGMLQSRGHLVTACSRYEDGRRMLLAQAFDVLLTEIRLGAYNGLQLAILGKDLHPDLQIVVFSGYDDPVLRDQAERLGGAYVPKQFLPERVLSAVQQPAEAIGVRAAWLRPARSGIPRLGAAAGRPGQGRQPHQAV